MIDLHLHSTKSDGQLAPLELARHLNNLGCATFAITDHNFLSPDLLSVHDYASASGMNHIFGLEVSSLDSQTHSSLHILGYGSALDSVRLNEELATVRAGYNRRAQNIIKKLNREYPGLRLDFEQLLEESGSSYLDRNRLAFCLQKFLDDGRSIKELLPEVFVPESADWLPETDEAIKLINDCGGLAVLAHPGRLMDPDQTAFTKLVDRLVNAGLGGIEAHYASHTPQQVTTLQKIADGYGLPVSGGSDWHGADYSPHKTPGCTLPKDQLTNLIKKFARKDE